MTTSPQEEPQDDLHEIDNLEHALYDPKRAPTEVTMHAYHDRTKESLPTAWGEEQGPVLQPTIIPEHGASFGLKIFFVALFALSLAIGFTVWRVMSSRNVVSAENIDIVLDVKPYVEGGEATPLTVSLLNRNTVSLQNAVLTLSYEKGVGAQDEQEKIYDKRTLGILVPNGLLKEDMTVVVYGAEADTRTLTIKLDYQVAGANATFNKTVSTSVVLKTPPIAVHIDGPPSLVQGQVATFTITATNNTSTTTAPALLLLSVPSTFSVQSATPKPATKGYVWDIEALPPGATSTITLTGSFTGQPGETNTIKASVGGSSGVSHEIGVIYAEDRQSVMVTAALLSLALRLETERGPSNNLRYGDKVALTFSYENKSRQAMKDVTLVLHIDGDAPILSGVGSDNGYYDSVARTVTFDATHVDDLALLPVGAKGTFTVRIPVVLKGTNAPVLKLTLLGSGTLASKDDTKTKVVQSWTVQGNATVSALSLFRNVSFTNSGPLPPVANQSTTYAAHITVSAQNSLSAAKVSFLLPGYVSWTGVYTKDTTVTYDVRSRKVTWNIGAVAAGSSVSADIQVSAKPSASHVGQMPPLTSGITLEADETESMVHIRTTTDALTTELTQESTGSDISHVAANVSE